MKNEVLEAALVNYACPLCGALDDGAVVINTILTKHHAKRVKELHNKTIGYSDKPCKECKGIMDQAILLIGVVEEKTTDPKNPYRSGNKWGVSEDFIERCFDPETAKGILKERACFFSIEAAEKMGFPDINKNA